MRNGHRIFIYIYIYTWNIGISKHEKHLRLLSSGTKLFITFEFKGSSTDTHSFYSGFFICPPSRVAPVTKATGLASVNKRKPTVFSWGRSQLNELTFSKSQKSSVRFRCVTSFALARPVSHLGYCDISEWHVNAALASTHVLMLHLSNPCTEPKGSQSN